MIPTQSFKAAKRHAKRAGKLKKSSAYVLQGRVNKEVYTHCLVDAYNKFKEHYAAIITVDQWGHVKPDDKNTLEGS